jgi:hypothetical protein
MWSEVVITYISLRCTFHGTVLSLNQSLKTSLSSPQERKSLVHVSVSGSEFGVSRERKSLVHVSVSGSECGSTLNFSMISRGQTFGFNYRPVRKISVLDITRSTPLGSSPHPYNQLHTPCYSRVSNL